MTDLAHDAWRPPILPVVALEKKGVDGLWDEILRHREFITASGELARRRAFRLREELREIVARRLEQRAREITTGERWDELQSGVIARTTDPWSAADEMLKVVGA
jgi:LAO/AO transport system kinase